MGNGILMLTLILTSSAWTVIILWFCSERGELAPGASIAGVILGTISGFMTTALIWSFMG